MSANVAVATRTRTEIYCENCNTLPGYSGLSSGYSGYGVPSSCNFCPLGPTTIKNHLTLSLNSFPVSRYSLSLSLPQMPSLSQTLEHKIPSQINPKTKEASNPPRGPSSPRIPPRGVFIFKFFARENLVQDTSTCAGSIYLYRRS